MVVLRVLRLHFLVRRCNDERRVRQRALLRLNPFRDVEPRLDRRRLQAALDQSALLLLPERMPRKHQRHAQQRRQVCAGFSRVRVVRMDHVRRPARVAKVQQRTVHKATQPLPQPFLGQVLLRAERNPHNVRSLGKRFDRTGVVLVDLRVHDQTRHQVDASHTRLLSQRPRQLHNILRLSARICVPAQLKIFPADQPVQAQQNHVQVLSGAFRIVTTRRGLGPVFSVGRS